MRHRVMIIHREMNQIRDCDGTDGNETDNAESNRRPGMVSATGSKYHKTNHCGNMNPDTAKKETKEEAEAQGLKPCGNVIDTKMAQKE